MYARFKAFRQQLSQFLDLTAFEQAPHASHYYTYLGDDILELKHDQFHNQNKALWLNVGYWKSAVTYPEACEALTRLLGEQAQLSTAHEALDCGFGFAEQDLLWLELYPQLRLTGINITPLHVERARMRVHARGLTERLQLLQGDAAQIPFEAAHFDRVLALESAFHFNTRQRFFEEAFRVLRPGGLLAMTDMLPSSHQPEPHRLQRFTHQRVYVPRANCYDRLSYEERLRGCGFQGVRVEPITAWTLRGYERYVVQRLLGRARDKIQVKLENELRPTPWGLLEHVAGFAEYVLVVAQKPGGSHR
ncbi:MAG: class I SAM-dependent methyltransferase [Myxococcota bacterium]